MRPQYVGAFLIAVLPIAYNISMHKLGMHAVDFAAHWLFAFWLLAAVVAFPSQIQKAVDHLKVKVLGIEIEDKQ